MEQSKTLKRTENEGLSYFSWKPNEVIRSTISDTATEREAGTVAIERASTFVPGWHG